MSGMDVGITVTMWAAGLGILVLMGAALLGIVRDRRLDAIPRVLWVIAVVLLPVAGALAWFFWTGAVRRPAL